jgi:hypothetical protein
MDNVDNKASSEPTEITPEAALHRKLDRIHEDLASLHMKFDAAVARIEELGGSMADNPALKAISKMFGGK